MVLNHFPRLSHPLPGQNDENHHDSTAEEHLPRHEDDVHLQSNYHHKKRREIDTKMERELQNDNDVIVNITEGENQESGS